MSSPDPPRSDNAARGPESRPDGHGSERDGEAGHDEPITPTESEAKKNADEDPPA